MVSFLCSKVIIGAGLMFTVLPRQAYTYTLRGSCFSNKLGVSRRSLASVQFSAAPLAETSLEDLTVPQLKERLRKLGLPVSGKKAELVDRIIQVGALEKPSSPAVQLSSTAQEDEEPEKVINPNSRTSSTTLGHLTEAKFTDLQLHAGTKRALKEVLGYSDMTHVQAQTLPVSLQGKDVLAKAKTGTGKTLGFLLPTIEQVLAAPAAARRGRVSALVISPTRELAQQIAEEAKQLLKFHDLGLQTVVGGTKMSKDAAALRRRTPDIVVATPGRLEALLDEDTAGFRGACAGLRVLVMDECDQLLDMGFRPSILRILRGLPPKAGRQSLLFSATLPRDVQEIAGLGLKPSYELVDCVGEEESTHRHVPQSVLVCSMETQLAELAQIVEEGRQVPGHKIIVFFTTARLTQFYAEIFNFMGVPVLEMHSRKSQSARTKISEQFRTQRGVAMFSSDVSARGMDYPDVTQVVQVGMPADRAQYVHRLGRTARAGGREGGRGVLLLAEFERPYLRQLSDLPLQPRAPSPPEALAAQGPQLSAALGRLSRATRGQAYQAWMGFYNGQLKQCRWSKEDLVRNANHWITAVCEAPEVPALQASTIGKMGLKGVPGLIKSTVPRPSSSSGGGRRVGGDSSGGGGPKFKKGGSEAGATGGADRPRRSSGGGGGRGGGPGGRGGGSRGRGGGSRGAVGGRSSRRSDSGWK